MVAPESTLLPADWTVPAHLRSRLGTIAGRQRVLHEDGHLLLVLHAPPGADDTHRRGRFFWRDPSGTWRAAPKAERVATLEQHLAEYRSAIEQLEQSADEAYQARDYFALLDRLTPLTRATRNLYEALQEAREAVRDDRQLIVARDQAYDLTRRADLLHADAKNGLDFAVAWQAEQQAESSYQMSVATHRLNLLVAFFFPIATLMTVLGANLRHGFEGWDRANSPVPLLAMLAAGLAFGFLLTGFVTRPARRPQLDLHRSSSSSATRRSK
ncbi:MAG: hypothetical protein WD738_02375 [Pirellulales bacterium]